MKHLMIACTLVGLIPCVGCGGGTSTSVPEMSGTWTMVFTGAAGSQSAAPPPPTTLTATLNQAGNVLSGTVIGLNNPQSSCLSGVANSQTHFTVSGTVTNPIEAGSNLQLTLSFVTGTINGSLQAQASASEAAANGLFSASHSGACTGGSFTMAKIHN